MNCQGDHTANYRGCPVYKSKIKAIVDPKTVTAKQRVLSKNQEHALPNNRQVGNTYASAVKNKDNLNYSQATAPEKSNELSEILRMLTDLTTSVKNIEIRVSNLEGRLNQPATSREPPLKKKK